MAQRLRIREADPSRGSAWNLRNASSRSASVDFGLRMVSLSRARFAAYLDDYAFLAHGLLELLQYRWPDGDLAFARELADVLLTHFEDPRGGFSFTADEHERLIHKPKPFIDEAVPAPVL